MDSDADPNFKLEWEGTTPLHEAAWIGLAEEAEVGAMAALSGQLMLETA